jgi:hypothetical protein
MARPTSRDISISGGRDMTGDREITGERQGLTLVHVRAQLEQLRYMFMR